MKTEPTNMHYTKLEMAEAAIAWAEVYDEYTRYSFHHTPQERQALEESLDQLAAVYRDTRFKWVREGRP